MDILSVLKQLNAAHGPSGEEREVRAKIEELARPYADEIITDTLGNLIVQKGSGPSGDVRRPHGLHRLSCHSY